MIQYKFLQILGNSNNNLNLVNAFADGNGNGKYCNGNSIDQLKNLVFPPGKGTIQIFYVTLLEGEFAAVSPNITQVEGGRARGWPKCHLTFF